MVEFDFIEDLYQRYRLKKLYKYIQFNKLWDVVNNVLSSYDRVLDDVYYDLEYYDNFLFSSDMSHIRTIAKYGWKKYFFEITKGNRIIN